MSTEPLSALADAIRRRNALDAEIVGLIGRPALPGHIGEYIAAAVFDIRLHASATHKGSDGAFGSGPLIGRSVNVKMYGYQEGLLDVKGTDAPELYLVLTGHRQPGESSRGRHRPVVVAHVHVFEHAALIGLGVRPGSAASVKQAVWTSAEVWPHSGDRALLRVSPEQARLLSLFA